MIIKPKQIDKRKSKKNISYFLILLIIYFNINIFLEKKNEINQETLNHKNVDKDINNSYKIEQYLINPINNITLIKLEGRKFIDNCFNKPKAKKIFSNYFNPAISVIIPIYNSEKNIFNSICSIQNQNYSNIEIILIDDFSTDHSYNIIKSLQIIDKRIKIVKNKKNMGSLYSRSIGVLMSKGEYIFPLDNDDMFFSEDIFIYILNIAKKFNFDIVGFRAFQISNYNNTIECIDNLYNYDNYPTKIIVKQPELSTWMISRNGYFDTHDVTIWAKCIKRKIYKEATVKLGIERYSKFISWAEDTIINTVIFSIANSFIFIHKYGIIHLVNFSTASFKMPMSNKLFGELLLTDIIYDFTKNNSDKNYAVGCLYQIRRVFKLNEFLNNTNLVIFFKSIINKILNSKFITNTTKINIKNDFKIFFN